MKNHHIQKVIQISLYLEKKNDATLPITGEEKKLLEELGAIQSELYKLLRGGLTQQGYVKIEERLLKMLAFAAYFKGGIPPTRL